MEQALLIWSLTAKPSPTVLRTEWVDLISTKTSAQLTPLKCRMIPWRLSFLIHLLHSICKLQQVALRIMSKTTTLLLLSRPNKKWVAWWGRWVQHIKGWWALVQATASMEEIALGMRQCLATILLNHPATISHLLVTTILAVRMLVSIRVTRQQIWWSISKHRHIHRRHRITIKAWTSCHTRQAITTALHRRQE
jgi:hypothetical protein